MKQLEKIEETIQNIVDSGIYLHETTEYQINSIAIVIPEASSIYYNKSKYDTKAELRSVLLHEKYHIESNALYTFDDSLQTRKRREFKANKAMILNEIPIRDLLPLLKNGYQKYEIADYFEVTENIIDFAIKIYKQMEMI